MKKVSNNRNNIMRTVLSMLFSTMLGLIVYSEFIDFGEFFAIKNIAFYWACLGTIVTILCFFFLRKKEIVETVLSIRHYYSLFVMIILAIICPKESRYLNWLSIYIIADIIIITASYLKIRDEK